jgi:hypothetical protein
MNHDAIEWNENFAHRDLFSTGAGSNLMNDMIGTDRPLVSPLQGDE